MVEFIEGWSCVASEVLFQEACLVDDRVVQMGIECEGLVEWFVVCEVKHIWMRLGYVCLLQLLHVDCCSSFRA